MMHRSVCRVQQIFHTTARRCYSTNHSIFLRNLIPGLPTRTVNPRKNINLEASSLHHEERQLLIQIILKPLPAEGSGLPSIIKASNQNGAEINHPLIAHGCREDDELINTSVYIPIPFNLGVKLVSPRWLQDNCPCPKCRRPDTMQREVDIFAQEKVPSCTARMKASGLEVTWADSHPDHVSFYQWDWLGKHVLSEPKGTHQLGGDSYIVWDAKSIKDDPPSVKYDEVMASDKGVGEWTNKIKTYGFCFVDGVPVCPQKTQELLERIAFIRPTHYGGFYDFTSDLTMKDTAYTSEAIGPHTDTTYFTDPAGLQMFHLLSHEDGTGGESLLVDGYRAIQELGKADLETLHHVSLSWHASGNEGVTMIPSRKSPVFRKASSFDYPLQIRWNNADRGVVGREFFGAWYKAAKSFNSTVNNTNIQYWEQLKPGRAIIFNNWRVLHGRSAFTGKRRMCGGYINYDDFISRWMNTNFTKEEILAGIL